MTAKKENKTNKSAADVADLEKQIVEKNAQIAEQTGIIDGQLKNIHEQEEFIAEKDNQIAELEQQVKDADACIATRDAIIIQLQEQLDNIDAAPKPSNIDANNLDVDVITVKLLPHHPTGKYLRCGIEFTLNITTLSVDDLGQDKLQILIDDPWLDVVVSPAQADS
ncbi:MAG: hypothetical protein KGV50_00375 [Gammaproteobacteria bacterium]|nr:hypothetical protein [Gammaproteobacteria bacterium]